MTQFGSFAKAIKDLIEKPFSIDNKVEVTAKAANGLTVVADTTLAGVKSVGNVNFKGKHGKLTIDKLSASSSKKVAGEFKFDSDFPDTQFSFKFADGAKATGVETTASVGVKIVNPTVGTVDVEVDPLTGPKFDLSFVKSFPSTGFFFGAAAKIATTFYGEETGDKKPAGACVLSAGPVTASFASTLVGYKAADFTAFAQTCGGCGPCGFDTLSFGLIHVASPTLTTVTSLALAPCKPEEAVKLTFGGAYKLNDSTTVSAVTNQDAKISLAYKTKVSPYATVTLNTQVDGTKLTTGSPKFGLTLALTN